MNANDTNGSLRPAAPARLAVTPDTLDELVKHPFLALPPQLRGEALVVWTLHKHLKGMESAFALAATLAVWIDRHGLAVDDARDVLAGTLDPGEMARAAFTSDFLTRLAARAKAAIDRRARLEADRRDRLQREHDARHDLPADEVRRQLDPLLQSFGSALPRS